MAIHQQDMFATRDKATIDPSDDSLGAAASEIRYQRKRLKMVGMTAIQYGVGVCILTFGAATGMFHLAGVILVGTLCAITAATFFMMVYSGFNLRFSEPSLAFPQALAGQTLIGCAYAVTGPAHAGTLILLAMVMFFGMFDMDVRHVRRVMVYTIVLMAVVMTSCA